MPLTTQALYFHLGMKADDDGFIASPKKIIRAVNCTEDDLKLLIAKGFVIGFSSGVIVITHWNMHNTIPKDRYNKTIHQDEFAQLQTDNKMYFLPLGNTVYTDCIQNDSTLETQIRLDKIRLDKNRLDTSSADADSRDSFDYQSVFDSFNRICKSLPKVQKLSESHKQKIRESNHLRKGKRHKYKINVSPKTVFELKNNGYSFNQISKMLNLDWGCVRQRYQDYIHDNPKLLNNFKNQ